MKLLSYLSLVFVLMFGIQACDSESSDPEGQSVLRVHLTDSPADYDSVLITFTEVAANYNEEWVTIMNEPTTLNLLDYQNGNTYVLGEETAPAGQYNQIRLIIDEARIVVDGVSHNLDVPSGAQTGLKLGPAFVLEPGITYELVVDFDARRSIVTMGPPSNPNGYKLKPVLRVAPLAVSGSISGIVTNPADAPIAAAISGTDTLATAFVNVSDGSFLLSYLGADTYSVSISDTTGKSFSQDNVVVTVGANTDIGSVTLN